MLDRPNQPNKLSEDAHKYDPKDNSTLAQFAGVMPAGYYEMTGVQLVTTPKEYAGVNRELFAQLLNILEQDPLVQQSPEAKACLALIRGQNDAQAHQIQAVNIQNIFKFLEQIQTHAIFDNQVKELELQLPLRELLIAHRAINKMYHLELSKIFASVNQDAGSYLHAIGYMTEHMKQHVAGIEVRSLEEQILSAIDGSEPLTPTGSSVSAQLMQLIESSIQMAALASNERRQAVGFDPSKIVVIDRPRLAEPNSDDIRADFDGQGSMRGIDHDLSPSKSEGAHTLRALFKLGKASMPTLFFNRAAADAPTINREDQVSDLDLNVKLYGLKSS